MRVLLVDDHWLVRAGMVAGIGREFADATIAEAASGAEALELAATEPFDLALIDLFLPGEKLFKLITDFGNAHVDVPVIVLSASTHAMHVRRCIDLGVAGYVTKSAAATELYEAIRVVMAGGTCFPDPATLIAEPELALNAEPIETTAISFNEIGSLLTARQLEILIFIAQGHTNKEIANQLDLSIDTVKVHVSAVLKSLGYSNRTQVAILGEKLGLTPPGPT